MTAVLGLCAVLFAAWFLVSLFEPFKGSGQGRVVVDIPRGANAHQIGDLLSRDGVVGSGFFFWIRAVIDGDRHSLPAGRVVLRRDMSYASALAALTRAHPHLVGGESTATP